MAALVDAAVAGSQARVQRLLDGGVRVDAAGPEGRTALMAAAAFGHAALLRFLLEKGADVHQRCDQRRTALMYAAGGSPEMVTLLLEAGAEVNVSDEIGGSPIIAAAQQCPQNVPLLLAAGANPNTPDTYAGLHLSLCFTMGPEPLPAAFCASLTALRRLDVAGYGNYNDSAPELPQEFSRLQQLQSLNLGPCNFGGLPPRVAALRGLTRLGIALPNVSDVEDDQILAGAAFLPRLRELVLFPGGPSDEDEPQPQRLPSALSLAASLERLDAGPALGCLELQPGDADLLAGLPVLRMLVLPTPEPAQDEEGQHAQHVPEWQDDVAWQQAQRTLLDGLAARRRAAGVEVRETPDGQPSNRRGLACLGGGFIELAPHSAAHAAAISRILKL